MKSIENIKEELQRGIEKLLELNEVRSQKSEVIIFFVTDIREQPSKNISP